MLTKNGVRKSPGPPVATIFVLGKRVFSAVKYGPSLAEGAAPTVIRLAVRELVVIVLAVKELMVVLSIITLEAINRILPLVVTNSPDVFVIELVAITF